MIMEELIGKSLFFGVAVSVVGYETGKGRSGLRFSAVAYNQSFHL